MGHSRSAISGLFFFFFLCFNGGSVSAANYLHHDCPNTTLFAPNSTYRRNLDSLLHSLSSNASRPAGFYNLSVGGVGGPDAAYGLFLCRGDVSAAVCKDCVETAAADLGEKCPNQKTSLIYYDECLVRYSNSSFFSAVARAPSLALLNTGNVSDPERFMGLLGTTIKDTAGRAEELSSSGKRFYTVEANFSSFLSLYTLAQCTPDLSSGDCKTCLDEAIGNLPGCCSGKPGGRVLFPSCNVRYELYPFYNSIAAPRPPPPPPVPPPPPTQASPTEAKGSGKGKISGVIIVVAIVVPILVSVVLFIIRYCILTRRAKKIRSGAIQQHNDENEITNVESLQFDFSTIGGATNNFSAENKLGEGGFGEVYKGTLPDGQEIAVKKLSNNSGQGAKEFNNEVGLLAKLQHRNLVALLGFCLERNEKMLVYEYVCNKSLDHFLFDPTKKKLLDWPTRKNIIFDIAKGVTYLHEDSRLRIIHCDLKPSNILLDEEMNAKIADFGIARIFSGSESHERTMNIVGTHGYMAPEYRMLGQFSVKSDVFSFGVILLEIITGKKSNAIFETDGAENLLTYVWKHWSDGAPMKLMDPSLEENCSEREVMRCIHVGLLCVQENAGERPVMSTVLLMLSRYFELPSPQRPAFLIWSRTDNWKQQTESTTTHSTQEDSEVCSVNKLTITDPYPRD